MNAAKVKKNSLTGEQINEAKLGQVPSAALAANAARLDGKAASDFLAAGGTAVNADKLDGVDSAVFGDAQTYTGVNFEPRETGAVDKKYEGTGSISCVGTPQEFTYRVQLPEGALVTQVDFRYVDNEAGTNAGFELRGYDVFEQGGPSSFAVALTSSTGSSAAERTVSAPVAPPVAIDNGRFGYQLNWSPFICSSNMELAGATVHYTLPTG